MIPANDNFSDAIQLSGRSFRVIGSNVGATWEIGEPAMEPGFPPDSVWYSWRAPDDGLVTVSTFRSRFLTTLEVYIGTRVDALQEISSNEQSPNSAVTFEADSGTTYQIVVDGAEAATGSFRLRLKYNGTMDRDLFYGNDRSNIFYGYYGNDCLKGNGGNDYLFGDAGRDLIRGGTGDDRLGGGLGNDILYGGGGQDYINEGKGQDVLYGGPGDDYLYGGPGNDILHGNRGENWLTDFEGDNIICGGNVKDTIYTGSGNDTIYSNGGNDYIYSGVGTDQIWVDDNAYIELSTGKGYDLIHNFSLGQTCFYLGFPVTFNDLIFTNSRQGAKIAYQNDLLAILVDTRADAVANSPDTFV